MRGIHSSALDGIGDNRSAMNLSSVVLKLWYYQLKSSNIMPIRANPIIVLLFSPLLISLFKL